MNRDAHYDVVIVGAGSAGCVLAARLSEDPTKRVLLIEAGPEADTTEHSSFFEAAAQPGRSYLDVIAERSTFAAPAPYVLGRGVGGSSAINAMIGMWGVPDDYDRWERDHGCSGWSWSSVMPVFARLGVPLRTVGHEEWGPIDDALVAAAQQFGHRFPADPLDAASLGVGPAMVTRSTGRRVSSADAYLEPVRTRPNLEIRSNTTVENVALEARRAVGVVTSDGDLIETTEVVVSAGAIHSPLLLLRSGVDRSGVGAGLKDHASFTFCLRLRQPADPTRLAAATLLRWSSSTGSGDLHALPLNHVGTPDYGALLVALMEVRSEGSIEIDNGVPVVRFGMLAADEDRLRLREAVRHAGKLVATDSFRAVAADVYVDDVGTRLEDLPISDDELDNWLASHIGDYYHASCSCRMGRRDDDRAVVDIEGRVHGYAGLRVCDASIFPDLPRANTHLPTMMVAERIARFMQNGSTEPFS